MGVYERGDVFDCCVGGEEMQYFCEFEQVAQLGD